jgi:hypothetical protein
MGSDRIDQIEALRKGARDWKAQARLYARRGKTASTVLISIAREVVRLVDRLHGLIQLARHAHPEESGCVGLPPYGEPVRPYCPAGVYEIVYTDAAEKKDPRFVINAQNCIL